MFILMTGYPPLEQADANDNWYRKICQKKYNKFWDKHRGCGLEGGDDGMPEARDLIEKLLCYQPTERLGSDEIAGHPWLANFPKLNSEELFQTMKKKHANAVTKKKADKTKQEQLQTSIVVRDMSDCAIPAIPDAGNNLPVASTFAILKEEGDDETACKERCSHLLNVFREIIKKKGGNSKREPRSEGDAFWLVKGQCVSADHQVMELEAYIVQKKIKGEMRQLMSYKVVSPNLPARLAMAEYINDQYNINLDSSVTVDDLIDADDDDEFDYAADFADMHNLSAFGEEEEEVKSQEA